MVCLDIGIRKKIDENPKTKDIFAILEPKTLPKVISLYSKFSIPREAAFIATNNSGAEVAKDTTVNPITRVDTLNLSANKEEDFTNKSPP